MGYKICTFASVISAENKAHLWLFDSKCAVIGEAQSVDILTERENTTIASEETGNDAALAANTDVVMASSDTHWFNFDSHLRYVVVTDLKDGKSPVVIKYMGKTWGGKQKQCWTNDAGRFVCSFEFDC